jgi:hypothetical protein
LSSARDIIFGDCGKKLRMFCTLEHVHYLEIGASHEKWIHLAVQPGVDAE